MSGDPIVIRFPNVSAMEANLFASDLENCLREISREVTVQRQKEQPDTQDFGATLAIILGTASTTAIAQGIGAWLRRHSGARIEISQHGKVVATNLNSADAAKIAEAFSPKRDA